VGGPFHALLPQVNIVWLTDALAFVKVALFSTRVAIALHQFLVKFKFKAASLAASFAIVKN
jgi:hypothetical protein